MNEITFINTPGYYYSIAYFLAAFLVIRTNRQRGQMKGWKQWFVHLWKQQTESGKVCFSRV